MNFLIRFSYCALLVSFSTVVLHEPGAFGFGSVIKKIADQEKYKDPEITQVALSEAATRNAKFAEQTAEAQLEQQWTEILKSKYETLPTDEPDKLHSLHMLRDVNHLQRVFSKDMAPYAPEGYVKHTHGRGTVAKVRLNILSTDTKYTGVFKTGGIGLARLSVIKMGGDMDSFGPNLSLHINVDRNRPITFLTMCSVDGQGKENRNFFSNPFTNAPGPANDQPANLIDDRFRETAKILAEKAQKPSRLLDKDHPTFMVLPLNEHASIENTGKVEENPVAPFEAVFIADSKVADAYGKAIQENKKADFRNVLSSLYKKGDVLFRLYVRDEALAKKVWSDKWENKANSDAFYKTGKVKESLADLTLLGEVVLESEFVASKAGDELKGRHTE